MISAQRTHQLHVASAANAGHFRAEGLGDLHGVGSHAARGAVDEHFLSGLEAARIAQALQRRDGGDRNAGGFFEGQVLGLRHEFSLLARDHVFGQSAVHTAVYLVTGFESRDLRAHRLHGARHVVSQAPVTGQTDAATKQANDARLAGGPIPLDRIDARGMHLDQNLVVFGRRPGNTFQPDALRHAITPLRDGAHGYRAGGEYRYWRARGVMAHRDRERRISEGQDSGHTAEDFVA
jgi:hypothetical protein